VNRYILPGQVCHVTHRCHDRAFLLKFARDRDAYRERLREALQDSAVHLLTYTITANHVHLLAVSDATAALAGMMHAVAGETAQAYNRRKGRSGAFWADRYHATMVETGRHLWACLRCIDLNMVPSGVMAHPAERQWTGWHELMGLRRRYRLLDLDQLLACLGEPSLDAFRSRYQPMVEDALRRRELPRQPQWTQSLAVGTEAFVRQAEGRLRTCGRRLRTVVEESAAGDWLLREAEPPYG